MHKVKDKILIIEDNEDVRKGFNVLINASENYEVCGDFATCEEAIKFLDLLNPQIILMDIDLPGMSGIEGTAFIKKKKPTLKILIITVFENSEKVFEALCAGANGYLTKNSNQIKLVEAFDEIMHGGAPMSTNIARMVVESFSKQKKIQNPLTDKENMVLTKLVEGKSYKSVSKELDISIDTVKFHIKNIYLKLQVNCKEDAIDRARENKWL